MSNKEKAKMGNFQILPEMGCKTTEEPLQTASWAEVAAPMTNDAVKQTANMSVRVGDADSSASNQKLKVERYTITVSNPTYLRRFGTECAEHQRRGEHHLLPNIGCVRRLVLRRV